ncbi:hypothetical protein BGZ90_011545 [Linnemannia elongata]|nr:hypothetical protein BGZ90_011545 [Linnemannia elongata]
MSDKRTPRSIELSESEINWLNSAVDKSPDAYFRTFEMNEKQSAHRRYARLVGSNNDLPESERKRLMDYFESWKTNSGLKFWCDRRTHLSAMRTASSLVEASEPYVDQSFSRNVSWIMTGQQQESIRIRKKNESKTTDDLNRQQEKHQDIRQEMQSDHASQIPAITIASYSLLAFGIRADLEHYKVLNQEVNWVVEEVDLVEHFRAFRSQHLHDFSLARDGIADMRHSSKFRKSLASHVGAVAGKVEPIITTIYEEWPTLKGIIDRVFAETPYEDVSRAVRDEDSHDPVVGYILYVVLTYLNYFTFHDEIPSDINEREGFMDLTWAFIRGAMTLARIETRSLEVLITGVQERKNHDKDPFTEPKQVGHYADGVAFHGSSQVYLSEASTIHNPKTEKCVRDEFKLARAMRDSWISQVRSTCRETVPRRGIAVFGSISFKDETKLWRLDFNGVFRLMQFDAFLVPLKKREFGIKAKAAVMRCLELALRVKDEIEARSADSSVVDYEERIRLEDAASVIESTTASPAKSRIKRHWSETL